MLERSSSTSERSRIAVAPTDRTASSRPQHVKVLLRRFGATFRFRSGDHDAAPAFGSNTESPVEPEVGTAPTAYPLPGRRPAGPDSGGPHQDEERVLTSLRSACSALGPCLVSSRVLTTSDSKHS